MTVPVMSIKGGRVTPCDFNFKSFNEEFSSLIQTSDVFVLSLPNGYCFGLTLSAKSRLT